MHWTDQAILLSTRRHGETSAVVSLLTREHGRHAGLVRGGAGKAARGGLQPGNRLTVTWKARLAEHLGLVTWELQAASGARWLHDPDRLAGIVAACALAEASLPEREAHLATYDGLVALLEAMDEDDWASLYIHWEIGLLSALGFGLDLGQCAVTGRADDLAYVSPRSGRAVGREAGEAYRDKLLPLPAFLAERRPASRAELGQALRLTGYFLDRHVGLPPARLRLVERLTLAR